MANRCKRCKRRQRLAKNPPKKITQTPCKKREERRSTSLVSNPDFSLGNSLTQIQGSSQHGDRRLSLRCTGAGPARSLYRMVPSHDAGRWSSLITSSCSRGLKGKSGEHRIGLEVQRLYFPSGEVKEIPGNRPQPRGPFDHSLYSLGLAGHRFVL